LLHAKRDALHLHKFQPHLQQIHVTAKLRQSENVELTEHLLQLLAETTQSLLANKDVHHLHQLSIHVIALLNPLDNVEAHQPTVQPNADVTMLFNAKRDAQHLLHNQPHLTQIHAIVMLRQSENAELTEQLLQLLAETTQRLHVNKNALHQTHAIVMLKQSENVELTEQLLQPHAETLQEQLASKDVQSKPHQSDPFQLFLDHVIVPQLHSKNADLDSPACSPNAEMMKQQLAKQDAKDHNHQLINVTVPQLQSENVEAQRKLQHAESTKATLADKDVLQQTHVIVMLKQSEFVEAHQPTVQLHAEKLKRHLAKLSVPQLL
jgi:hypothetical protein